MKTKRASDSVLLSIRNDFPTGSQRFPVTYPVVVNDSGLLSRRHIFAEDLPMKGFTGAQPSVDDFYLDAWLSDVCGGHLERRASVMTCEHQIDTH